MDQEATIAKALGLVEYAADHLEWARDTLARLPLQGDGAAAIRQALEGRSGDLSLLLYRLAAIQDAVIEVQQVLAMALAVIESTN